VKGRPDMHAPRRRDILEETSTAVSRIIMSTSK
jgi:hypothetical protein